MYFHRPNVDKTILGINFPFINSEIFYYVKVTLFCRDIYFKNRKKSLCLKVLFGLCCAFRISVAESWVKARQSSRGVHLKLSVKTSLFYYCCL